MPSPPSEPWPDDPRANDLRLDALPGRLAAALRRFLWPFARTREQSADPSQRLALDLEDCRHQRDRWRRHADSYERELTRVRMERAHLLAWLAALHPSSAVLTDGGGAGAGGSYALSLRAGERGLSWSLAPAELPLFTHVPHAEPASSTPLSEADQAAHIRDHTRLLAIEGILSAAPAERPSPIRSARSGDRH
ncbi:hypothetical protein BN159_2728 [Streptomyces davaonensis JCM 4913]|uniref:Uncharacterized protein n=1 Tax=Streptomyces davaonensis (strain DSM 101723 / JCM 4913 / KCC S-0913 / 768) TaxID=1214101 RepID=K4R1U2_STRDJ|nr:hypothetical protein [Streptomyces davaonensis]CCK27107.1 hypothetical protein BN159_2728 [Streptomyces davaonensis JCM 4913]